MSERRTDQNESRPAEPSDRPVADTDAPQSNDRGNGGAHVPTGSPPTRPGDAGGSTAPRSAEASPTANYELDYGDADPDRQGPSVEVHRAPASPPSRNRPAAAKPASRPGSPHGRSPRKSDLATVWLVLIGLLCFASAPLMLDTQLPQLSISERWSIDTAWELRDRLATTNYDEAWGRPLIPTYGQEPLFAEPPLTAWVHALALTGLSPPVNGAARGTPATHRLRIRLVSAGFAMLTIAALLWAGYSVGGLLPAAFAGLVLLAMPALVIHGRLATNTAPTLAWIVLSTAGALWAMRPFRPAAGLARQAAGWVLAGLGFALALLTGGPGVIVPLVLPLIALAAICPRQLSNALGLLAMLAVGVLGVTPWVLLISEHDTSVWAAWGSAIWPGLDQGWGGYFRDMGYRVIWLAVLVLPWSPWVIAGLVQPLSTSSKGVRTRMFLGWAWFVAVAVLVLIDPRPGRWAGLALAVPPVALMVGQLFRQYDDLSSEGRHARSWRIGRWPMSIGLAAVSLLLPAAAYGHQALIDAGMLAGPAAEPVFAAMGWPYWAGGSAALLGVATLSVRYAAGHYPARAFVCWGLWTAAGMVVVLIPLVRGPLTA